MSSWGWYPNRVRFYGTFIGTVADNKDPNNLGRLRVRIPQVHGDIKQVPDRLLEWAWVITPGSGTHEVGIHLQYEIGATVAVQFEQGYLDRPYVVGGVSKKPTDDWKYGRAGEAIGVWSPSDTSTDIPQEIRDSHRQAVQTLYKSPKGAAVIIGEEQGNEYTKIIDRLGQVIKFFGSVKEADNQGNASRRGIASVEDGTQLPYSKVIGAAGILFEDLAGQYLRFNAESGKEQIILYGLARGADAGTYEQYIKFDQTTAAEHVIIHWVCGEIDLSRAGMAVTIDCGDFNLLVNNGNINLNAPNGTLNFNGTSIFDNSQFRGNTVYNGDVTVEGNLTVEGDTYSTSSLPPGHHGDIIINFGGVWARYAKPTTTRYLKNDQYGNIVWAEITAGHIIQDDSVSFSARSKLNFTGSGVAIVDDEGGNATNVIISGSSGGHVIKDIGATYAQQPNLTFLGNVTVTNNPGNSSTDVTITGVGHTIQRYGTPFTPRSNLNFTGVPVSVTDDGPNDATIVNIVEADTLNTVAIRGPITDQTLYLENALALVLGNDGIAGKVKFIEAGGGVNYTAFTARAQAGNIDYQLPDALPIGSTKYLTCTPGGDMGWTTGGGAVWG